MRVAVIGAGLAGLSAACELADGGHVVTIFEKRPWAGGKTYSFEDGSTGELVDNGQHVFMACTTAYTDFLRKLGTLCLARQQRRLRVRVFDAHGREAVLAASMLPAPFHLAPSFARYGLLSLRERVRVGRLMLRIHRMSEEARLALHPLSFGAWLREQGQSERAIREFWDFFLVPTLNCRCDEASAADALFVLREGFLKSSTSAALGIPAVGLSSLHVDPAVAYVAARGGSLRTGSTVKGLAVRDGEVTGVCLAGGEECAADAVVCAVPHAQVASLVPAHLRAMEPFLSVSAMRSAPIVNLHLWFDRPVADFAFAAFPGSELQWVFNRAKLDREPGGAGDHLVVSLSAAGAYMGLTKQALQERFLPLLRAALPLSEGATLVKFAAIKEPDATFVPAPGLVRPGSGTPLPNLVLAGAYTATGWPATMESAVRSGISAARALTLGLHARDGGEGHQGRE